MGTCCEAHLGTKVRDYALNAQNGAVTVQLIENPDSHCVSSRAERIKCDYCNAPAIYIVSYFPKR